MALLPSPVSTSHSFTVLSSLADTIWVPSGEKDALRTQLACPCRLFQNRRLGRPHSFTHLSSPAESRRSPLKEKSTLRTAPACAFMHSLTPRTPGVQIRTLPSTEPDASRPPSREYLVHRTGPCEIYHRIQVSIGVTVLVRVLHVRSVLVRVPCVPSIEKRACSAESSIS